LGGTIILGRRVAASLTTVLRDGVTAIGPGAVRRVRLQPRLLHGLLESITIHGGSNKLDVYASAASTGRGAGTARVEMLLAAAGA